MMTMQTLFFGTIAAFVFLLWFNEVVRRRRMEKVALRYLERSAPRRSGEKRASSPLAGILLLGLLLLGTSLALVNVKAKYLADDPLPQDLVLLYTSSQTATEQSGPPGKLTVQQDHTALGAARKTGVYPPPDRQSESVDQLPMLVSDLSPLRHAYGIQVAALNDLHKAEHQLDQVKTKLPQATVNLCLSQQNGALHYKVILGLHPDEAAARQSLPDVRRLYPGSFPVSFRDLSLLN